MAASDAMTGMVVKLDRGYPLVRLRDGRSVRCEHATTIVKGERVRAVIGDEVEVDLPDGHDKGIVVAILPRTTQFVRKDPAQRTTAQVLAANFQLVMVVEPLVELNRRRLERELVLAHDTGARVAVVLTKFDLAGEAGAQVRDDVQSLAGADVPVVCTASNDEASIAQVRALVAEGEMAILIGKSGVGKSTLVNLLAGSELQQTSAVRDRDGKGRHTTVDRVVIDLPGGGAVVDMPGIRGLGMWDADQGLDAAFPDVEALAARCRFRDCSHEFEPGCAVRAAVESGELAAARAESYRSLSRELEQVRERREESSHMRGEKASDRRKQRRDRR